MRVAKQDTFGTEDVYGTQIRRFVRGGDPIPANLTVPDSDVEDVEDSDSEQPKESKRATKGKKSDHES